MACRFRMSNLGAFAWTLFFFAILLSISFLIADKAAIDGFFKDKRNLKRLWILIIFIKCAMGT